MYRHVQNTKRRKTGLAKRIDDARKKADLSQPEAAQAWGVNLRTLQDWEAGRRDPRGFARAQLDKLLDGIHGPSKRKP